MYFPETTNWKYIEIWFFLNVLYQYGAYGQYIWILLLSLVIYTSDITQSQWYVYVYVEHIAFSL